MRFDVLFVQTLDCGLNGCSCGGAHGPRSTGNASLAALAFPYSDGLPPGGVLSTEGAVVGGVLEQQDLLGLLPKGSSVTGAVLSGQAHLLRTLRHFV